MRRFLKSVIGAMLILITLGSVVNCAFAAHLSPLQVQVVLEDKNGDGLKDLCFSAVKDGNGVENLQINVSSSILAANQPLLVGLTDSNGSCVFFNLPPGTYFWSSSDCEPNSGNVTVPIEELSLTEEEGVAWQTVMLGWIGEAKDGAKFLFQNMSLSVGFDLSKNPFPSPNGSLLRYSEEIFRWFAELERYMSGLKENELSLFHKMIFPFKATSFALYDDAVNGVDFSQVTNETLRLVLNATTGEAEYNVASFYSNCSLAGYHQILRLTSIPEFEGAVAFPLMQIISAFMDFDNPDFFYPAISWDASMQSTDPLNPLNLWILRIEYSKSLIDTIATSLNRLNDFLKALVHLGANISQKVLNNIDKLVGALNIVIRVTIIVLYILHWGERYHSLNAFIFNLLQGDPVLLTEVATVIFSIILVAYFAYLVSIGATASTGIGIGIAIIETILLIWSVRADYEDAITTLRKQLSSTLTNLFVIRQALINMNVSSVIHLSIISQEAAKKMKQFAIIAHQHSSDASTEQFFEYSSSNFETYSSLETELGNAVGNATNSLNRLLEEFLSWNDGLQGQVSAHLEGYYSTMVNYTPLNFTNYAVVGTGSASSLVYEKKDIYAYNLDGYTELTTDKEIAETRYHLWDVFHWFPYWGGWAFDPPVEMDPDGNSFAVFYNIPSSAPSSYNPFEYRPAPSYLDYRYVRNVTTDGFPEKFYHYKFYFDEGTTKYGPGFSISTFLWGLVNGDVLKEWLEDLNSTMDTFRSDFMRVQSAIQDLTVFQGTNQTVTDTEIPRTVLSIGKPSVEENGKIYINPATPITLSATDQGSGVATTGYRIRNGTFDTDWNLFTSPRSVIYFYFPRYLADGQYMIDYNSTDSAGNMEPTKTISVALEHLYVNVDIRPSPLNLKVSGTHVTLYLGLFEQYFRTYDFSDVDLSTILVNDSMSADLSSIPVIADYNNDGVLELAVEFNRSEISQYILSSNSICGNVTLTLTGLMKDGGLFEGSGRLLVRMPGDMNMDGIVGMRDIAPVARAFGSDPTGPRWDPVADENEDGEVNLKDVAIVSKLFGRTYVTSGASENSNAQFLTRISPTPANTIDGLTIDMKDIGSATRAFNSVVGDPSWNPYADITGLSGQPDGKVDMRDISLLARHFGEHYP
jgi:hypothetical protein